MSDTTDAQPPEGFSADWLALREDADHRARNLQLTHQLIEWTEPLDNLHVVELGAGTGSNFRYLSPRLGHAQHWTLYDNDPLLLSAMTQRLRGWCDQHGYGFRADAYSVQVDAEHFNAQVTWQQCDLANSLTTLPLAETHLVTGSALLDLTSAAWLELLARYCIVHHCASLFVLNYNGHVQWHEPLPTDAQITDLLNAHQLKDKGFGPALGPQAHAFFEENLSTRHRVFTGDSHWQLDHESLDLQQALVNGWGPAAIEQDSTAQPMVAEWMEQRTAAVTEKQSSLRVGHTDVLGLPPSQL